MVTIYATYSEMCFCQRPTLTAEARTAYEPTFRFAKAARLLASSIGAVNFQLNKRSTGRSAYAELPHKCSHRDRQAIRFDWRLY